MLIHHEVDLKHSMPNGDSQTRRAVLILGERGAAQILARQFGQYGFAAQLAAELRVVSQAARRERQDLGGEGDAHLDHYFDGSDCSVMSQDLAQADLSPIREMRELLQAFACRVNAPAWIHPGTTSWGERAHFHSLAAEFGLSVLAPAAQVLILLSDRLNFLGMADSLGIAHLVLSFDPIHSLREVEALNARHAQSFPYVLKTVHGGSSGLYVVQNASAWSQSLPLWFDQLRRSSGEVILFAERYLESARHIVMPFARFRNGDIQVFPPLDASLQCRYRKMVEICPAARIDEAVLTQLRRWTQSLAQESGFVGVGSMEFLVDSSRAFLIRGLPRLEASFRIWEMVAGVSALEYQLATLLEEAPHRVKPRLRPQGCAMALQIFAEDSQYLLPRAGTIAELSPTTQWENGGSSAQFTLNYDLHQNVPISSSGRVGLLIVYQAQADWAKLFELAQQALSDLWIAGSVQTNEHFLSEILNHPWVKEGMYHAGFIDEDFLPSSGWPREALAEIAKMVNRLEPASQWWVGETSIDLAGNTQASPQLGSLRPFTVGGRPGLAGILESGDSQNQRFLIYPLPDRYIVRLGNRTLSVRRRVTQGAQKFPRFRALVAGRVQTLLYRSGVEIREREPLLVLESLGLFIPHGVPMRVRVREWRVKPDQYVQVGQELAEIEYTNQGP